MSDDREDFKHSIKLFRSVYSLLSSGDEDSIDLVRKEWCKLLHKSDRLYHFDDDAYEIFQDCVPEKYRLDDETCELLNRMRDSLYGDKLFGHALTFM